MGQDATAGYMRPLFGRVSWIAWRGIDGPANGRGGAMAVDRGLGEAGTVRLEIVENLIAFAAHHDASLKTRRTWLAMARDYLNAILADVDAEIEADG
jgi:hypothetical protein